MELIEKHRSIFLPQLNPKYETNEKFIDCIVLKDFQNQSELKLYTGEFYLGAKLLYI